MYYELTKYVHNGVGAEFIYCTDKNLEECKKKYDPNEIEEISKERYEEAKQETYRKNYCLATGRWLSARELDEIFSKKQENKKEEQIPG